MMNSKSLNSVLIVTCLLSLIVLPIPFDSNALVGTLAGHAESVSESSRVNSTYANASAEGSNIRSYDPDQVLDSFILLSMDFYPNFTASSKNRVGHLFITDRNGNIKNGPSVPRRAGSPKFINSTTVMVSNGDTGNIDLPRSSDTKRKNLKISGIPLCSNPQKW